MRFRLKDQTNRDDSDRIDILLLRLFRATLFDSIQLLFSNRPVAFQVGNLQIKRIQIKGIV